MQLIQEFAVERLSPPLKWAGGKGNNILDAQAGGLLPSARRDRSAAGGVS